MLTDAPGALINDAKINKLYSSYCIENCVINTKKVKNVSFYGHNFLFWHLIKFIIYMIYVS